MKLHFKRAFAAMVLAMCTTLLPAGGAVALTDPNESATLDTLLTGGDGDVVLFGQEGEGEGEEEGAEPNPEGGETTALPNRLSRPGGVAATPGGLAKLPEGVETALTLCSAVPREYVVDCILVQMRETLAATPSTADYADMRAVLQETVAELDRLVRENEDKAKPRIRVQARAGARATRTSPIRAVRSETVAAVNARALGILDQAETRLLRSAETNPAARLQYVRVAQAIGSNKVLLRSS